MKFVVSSGELMQHLQTVAKIISTKSVSVVPVLGNILFELEGNQLKLSAADLSSRITSTLEVSNEGGAGSFTVPERIILESIKELPDQPVSLEVSPESLEATLTYSNGHYNFVATSSDTYPQAISLEGSTHSLSLSARALQTGLERTIIAASSDERRPIMTGVNFDFLEDKLILVASDGRILVKYTDHNVKPGFTASFCMPGKISQLLSRSLLPKENADITLSYDDKYVCIQMERFTLTAKLLDGRFPNYNSVIPSSSPYAVVVDRESLLYAAKRVSIFSNKASNLILLEVGEEQIRITANDLDFSVAAEESIPCQCLPADARIRIGFDFNMLQQLLSGLSSEQITLDLADQTRAGVITPSETEEGIEICSLIIPLKLVGE